MVKLNTCGYNPKYDKIERINQNQQINKGEGAMIYAKVAFVVYGVHKDGLKDPMGVPFIDDQIIENSKKALRDKGLELIEEDLIVASKQESRQVICGLAKRDDVDCLVLFSGTWVWAAHMIAAVREFAKTGKGIVIWTHPGSQGWRSVGGLVLKAALNEIGVQHRYVYGEAGCAKDVGRVVSYCQAAAVKNRINMKTLMAFGGRGMGQTCGVADPAQWMKVFGIDIDTRDTTELIETAKDVTAPEIEDVYKIIEEKFVEAPAKNEITERSIRLYIAIKKLLQKYDCDFYTIQSFPGMADDYTASCFAQSMMLEDGTPTSTLSDFNTALTSILMIYLSNERTYYGDFQAINKETREIKIIGDGCVPPSLANKYGARFAGHGIPTEGKSGGLSVDLVCKEGKGVLARFSRKDGKFRMVVTRCEVKEPTDDEIQGRRGECGIPFWPHAFVTALCDIDALLECWDNEYACLGYGEHLYQQLIDFCEQTGIEVLAF
jgi:L-fucose isomerase-like protein